MRFSSKIRPRVLGCLLAAGISQANAMDFTLLPPDKNGDLYFSGAGDILQGDGLKFKALIGNAKNGGIQLASNGGVLIEGLMIGSLIREHNLTSFVSRGHVCLSACALAWIASPQRGLQDGAYVGFHAAFSREAGRAVVGSSGNAMIGAYLGELGFSYDAIWFLTEAGPDEVTYITKFTADKYSIKAGFLDASGQLEWHGEQRYAAQTAVEEPAKDKTIELQVQKTAKELAELPNIAAACRKSVDPKTFDYMNCYSLETENLHWAVTSQAAYNKATRISCWGRAKSNQIMRWTTYRTCVERLT